MTAAEADASPAPDRWTPPAVDGAVFRRDEPLARHNAWRCGGPCDVWVVVHRRHALELCLAALRAAGLRWVVLGAGTRTIVRDGGVVGAVLRLGAEFHWIELHDDGLSAGAATPACLVAAASVAAGFTGLEAWAGVPGTVGAAVLYDETKVQRHVASVDVWSRGRSREVPPAEVVEARDTGRPPIVVGARFQLERRDPARLRVRMEDALKKGPANRWFTLPHAGDAIPSMVRSEVVGARLRGAAVPASAPALLVALQPDAGRDLELLAGSIMERVQHVTGHELQVRVGFLGRVRAEAAVAPAPVHPGAIAHKRAKSARRS